ncbi:unnamed protein product [Lactuca saligna]|uniref:Protein transport protein SEC23 n=1 Tax=Lactuca saligna TaxID=75948 RepID=A0AA35ZX86_LACSI|nr:unnamed protein product [Lactuca saligna]
MVKSENQFVKIMELEPGSAKDSNGFLFPVTSSRNAKWWYSAFHNFTDMVGVGVLSLPYTLSQLGWGFGIIVLVLSWVITLYTLWQMVETHEMSLFLLQVIQFIDNDAEGKRKMSTARVVNALKKRESSFKADLCAVVKSFMETNPLLPTEMVEHLKTGLGSQGQIAHIEEINSRIANFVKIPDYLSEGTKSALKCSGLLNLTLNMNCCNCITDADMKPLSDLRNLEELQISSSKVTDNGVTFLKGLHKLALLNIERCPITAACLDSLSDLVALLFLNTSTYTELKSLKVLNLGFNDISDAVLSHLKGLINLESLNLDSVSHFDIDFSIESFLLPIKPNLHLPSIFLIISEDLSDPVRSHKDLDKDSALYFTNVVKFYEELAKQMVGVAEMKMIIERTGGIVVLAESFGHSIFKDSFKHVFEKGEESLGLAHK